MYIEPVIIFSITEQSEGTYAINLFGGDMLFNVNPIREAFNHIKSIIPAKTRLIYTAYRATVDIGYEMVAKFL